MEDPISVTGQMQYVDKSTHKSRQERFQELIDRKLTQRDHFWVMMVAYRVENPEEWVSGTSPQVMDTENLLSVDDPGCYICEEPYSKKLAMRKCRGDN